MITFESSNTTYLVTVERVELFRGILAGVLGQDLCQKRSSRRDRVGEGGRSALTGLVPHPSHEA